MNENQTTDTDFDPFADDTVQSDAIPAQPGSDDVLDGVEFGEGDDLDDLFAGADLDMEEEDSGEEISYRETGAVYDNPLDVGIKDKMWVPVMLRNVTFKEKHTPRLSSKVCLAVKVDENGKKRIYVPYSQVEAALAAGATEVIRDFELPYFIGEANHVTPEFGQRRFPYEIEVPGLTIKTAYFKEQRSGRTGYKNENGYSLRKATGATEAGEKVNLQTMPTIATRMEEKIVMARISITTKVNTRPRLDPVSNKPISVLADAETGQPVTVIAMERQKNADGTLAPREYMLDDGSGSVWDGNPKLLIPVDEDNGVYAIADSGENSATLMEKYTKVTDYINPPFLPVPEREIEVEMIDDKAGMVSGVITWGTIGAITQGKAPGTSVDVLLKTGKTVTAVWLGTQWVEVAADGGSGGGLDEFSAASSL